MKQIREWYSGLDLSSSEYHTRGVIISYISFVWEELAKRNVEPFNSRSVKFSIKVEPDWSTVPPELQELIPMAAKYGWALSETCVGEVSESMEQEDRVRMHDFLSRFGEGSKGMHAIDSFQSDVYRREDLESDKQRKEAIIAPSRQIGRLMYIAFCVVRLDLERNEPGSGSSE